MKVPELFRFNRRWGIGHQVGAFGSFGERDHVANTWSAAENGVEPIESERNAPVRRRSITESFKHVAEASSDHLRGDLEHFFQNGFLQIGLMDTDRAAAKLHTIHYDIVMLSPHFFEIALQQRD